MNNEIDQDAVNLARAIRQKESGGNFNAIGDSGTSNGAYQWQPGTWKAHAKQVLGNEMAPMTKENQNAVAYGVIKGLKDSGKNVAQIAAIWNSGTDKDWETKKGYNAKLKVNYDVPAYVSGVIGNYQKIKTGGAPPVEVPAEITAPAQEYKSQVTPPSQLPPTIKPSFAQDFRDRSVKTLTKLEDTTNDPSMGYIEKTARNAGTLGAGLSGVIGDAVARGVPALIRGAAGLVMPQAQAQQVPQQISKALFGDGTENSPALQQMYPGPALAMPGGVPALVQGAQDFEKYAADRENNPATNVLYNSVVKPVAQVGMAALDVTGAASALRSGFDAAGSTLLKSSKGLLSKERAIDGLEGTYKALLEGQSPSKQKKFYQAGKVTEMKNAAGTTGKAPERILAEAGIIPKQEGARLTTLEQADDFRKSVEPLRNANRTALAETKNMVPPTRFDEIEQAAIRNIIGGTPAQQQAAIQRIQSEIAAAKAQYGEAVDLLTQDGLKSSHWGATKFDAAVPQLDRDVQYALAKAYQQNIERVAKSAGFNEVAQLNRHIGDSLEAAKFLEGLNGKIVKGGRLNNHMFRLIGSSTGTTVLGKILGAVGGDAVANLLISTEIAGPVKRMILQGLQAKDPAAYKKALEWIKKTQGDKASQLLLPEGPMVTPAPVVPQGTPVMDQMYNSYVQDKNIARNTLRLPEGPNVMVTPNTGGTPNPIGRPYMPQETPTIGGLRTRQPIDVQSREVPSKSSQKGAVKKLLKKKK